MTAAFRQLGIRPDYFKYLVMMAESPIDGKNYFFVDKCLPFGSSISCKHFQEFSNVVAHVVQSMTRRDLLNYLDNFFFVALLRAICNQQVDTFLKVCQQINFLVSLEKTFCATTLLTFLRMLIDTVNQTVSILSDKILKAKDLIGHVLTKRSMTVKQLQKICGFLNFLGRAIVPERAFTRRMYMKLQGPADLKPHHHIKVTKDIKQDLLMWNDFIHHPSVYCRGFMDFSEILTANDILMFSDASKNPELGMGGICNNFWMYQQWNKSFVVENDPSIEFLELYAVLATVLNWLHRFKNCRIVLFCDNQSIVHMINKTTSSCSNCLNLIRKLVLHSLKLNVWVFAKYITSRNNKNADLLSRMKIASFRERNPQCDDCPTAVPEEIWPMSKVWLCN